MDSLTTAEPDNSRRSQGTTEFSYMWIMSPGTSSELFRLPDIPDVGEVGPDVGKYAHNHHRDPLYGEQHVALERVRGDNQELEDRERVHDLAQEPVEEGGHLNLYVVPSVGLALLASLVVPETQDGAERVGRGVLPGPKVVQLGQRPQTAQIRLELVQLRHARNAVDILFEASSEVGELAVGAPLVLHAGEPLEGLRIPVPDAKELKVGLGGACRLRVSVDGDDGEQVAGHLVIENPRESVERVQENRKEPVQSGLLFAGDVRLLAHLLPDRDQVRVAEVAGDQEELSEERPRRPIKEAYQEALQPERNEHQGPGAPVGNQLLPIAPSRIVRVDHNEDKWDRRREYNKVLEKLSDDGVPIPRLDTIISFLLRSVPAPVCAPNICCDR
ncbi:hypothetical protein OIY81_3517 [Cryptosporidium canis]|nr:hypothetical protein OIY81_3517 [Cryptosporidium canis]